jgi:hypothetical protein
MVVQFLQALACGRTDPLLTIVRPWGVAGFLWLGGSRQSRRRRRREFESRRYPIGTPDKFSHRICTNLRGPPDRPWGVRTPGPPRPATPLVRPKKNSDQTFAKEVGYSPFCSWHGLETYLMHAHVQGDSIEEPTEAVLTRRALQQSRTAEGYSTTV